MFISWRKRNRRRLWNVAGRRGRTGGDRVAGVLSDSGVELVEEAIMT